MFLFVGLPYAQVSNFSNIVQLLIHTDFMSRITLESEPLLLLWLYTSMYAHCLQNLSIVGSVTLSRVQFCKRTKRFVDGTRSILL